MTNKIELLAIGDTVVDAFIRLSEAEETFSADHKKREICMTFGDKIPFEFATVLPAVGNSANAAVSFARLGFESYLLSNVGDDSYGKECIDHLKGDKVHTDFVKVNAGKKTNYHYVLWFHNERTILIKHEEYDYELPKMEKPQWIYLSSLSKTSLPFHKMIEEYVVANPDVNVAFQPGTFQISLGTEALAGIYKNTNIFFCNVEEAEKILGSAGEVKEQMKKLASLGPKIVVVTDGPNGSYAYDTASDKAWFMPLYPDPKEPYERTGAGDAFGSTFTAAVMRGKEIPEAMAWASINSMSVVQYVGAQEGLLSEVRLLEYMKSAPKEFVAKEI